MDALYTVYSRCYRGIRTSTIALVARSIDIGVGSNVIWQVYTDMIASDLNIIKYCSPLALSVFNKEVWVLIQSDSSECHRVR